MVSDLLRTGEKLVVKDTIGNGRARKRHTVSFIHALAEKWGVHNNNLENLLRAISERVFLVKANRALELPIGVSPEGEEFMRPPLPTVNIKKELQPFTNKLFHAVGIVQPISTKQFVDTYVGRKKRMYEAALVSLESKPIARADAIISAFIKDEKTDFGKKPRACPRIIQPRSPRFNVVVGVYLKPLEKALFHGIAEVYKGVTVAKGLNCFARGKLLHRKWRGFNSPVAIMLDATRFDQHCNSNIIEWKHYVEEHFFPELKRYNAWRKRNVCYARTDDGSVKYVVEGCTMSGDMDTASGNCLIMCALTWTVMRAIGVVKYEYMNDGDDGVLIVEKDQVECVRTAFQREFLKYGFQMKWDGDTDEFEQIEFCQCQPIWDGKEWRMVRRPSVALAKDAITVKRPRSPLHLEQLRSNLGWTGLSIAGDLPIYHVFYRKYITMADSREGYDSGMAYMARDVSPRGGEPTMEARVSFWKAFHITPDNQRAIEHTIQQLHVPKGSPIPVAKHYINTTIDTLTTITQH